MSVNTEATSSISKVPVLTGVTNYFSWLRAISPILLGFRALSIVEGQDKCPIIGPMPTSAELKTSEAWKDRDAKAMGIIDQTVSASLYAMIKNLRNSHEKWTTLSKLNNLNTAEHRAKINKKVHNLFLDESGDMTAHLTTFVELAAEAEAAGLSWGIDDIEKSDRFLDTLPHTLRVVKTEWRTQPESERSFFSLIQLHNEEEAAKQRSADRTAEAAAMAAFQSHRQQDHRHDGKKGSFASKKNSGKNFKHQKPKNAGTVRCYGCGKNGHVRNECHKTKHLPADTVICWKCYKPGHTMQDCRTQVNNHANAAVKNEEHTLPVLPDDHAMFTGSSDPNTIAFMIDSGASQHIVAHEWMLINARDTPNVAFKTVGAHLSSSRSGDIRANLLDGRHVLFKDACYLPGGNVNLLSEELLRERGWLKVVNEKGDAALKNKNKPEVSFPLHKHGRARYLVVKLKTDPESAVKTDPPLLAAATTVTPGSLMEHHIKLGHISLYTLKRLVKASMIEVKDPDSLKTTKLWCETCVAAKSTRDPFNDTPFRATKPLELVVSDVTGPFKPCIGGYTYFVTFIDEYTNFTSAVLMKSKDEVFAKMQTWVKTAETAFDCKVQVLRTDGGGEYVNKAMTAWLETKGILHHTTTPHSPQLNGKAERMNRTLKDMTAAMLIGSSMKTHWWGHALLFAISILTRITKFDEDKCLWEVIHKRKPDLTKAHAFGEECWVHIPAADRNKSDLGSPKAWKGKLVSWPTSRSGWGVYNPTADKVVFSRDVKFGPANTFASENDIELEAPSVRSPSTPTAVEPQLDDMLAFDESDDDFIAEDDEPRHRLPAGDQQREHVAPQVRNEERAVRELPQRARRGQHSDWYRNNFVMMLQRAEGHLFPISPIIQDPLTYKEALARPEPERQEWLDAIQREFDSLIKNGTLEEVVVPEGANIVTTKHVFKTKYDANGNFIKRKDRCVARGFTQEFGIDYDDTYAPVARMTSLRIFLVIVIIYNYITHQADVETAFLHSDMDRPLYIECPEGWFKKNPKATGLLVKKGLYGFKQSARLWWLHLSETLINLGFKHSEYDWGIFSRPEKDGSITIVFVYVDDMIIAGKTQSAVDNVRAGLKKAYSLTDIGEISSVLGISVKRTKDSASLTQTAYIETVLDRFGLADSKSEPTPIATGTKLTKEGTPLEGGKDGIRKYQALIGCLLWIALSTRPDISYAVSTLARFNSCPTKDHWRVGMRVLRYLKGTKDLCLVLKPNLSEPLLSGYSDADWAGDSETRRSQSGYIFKLHGCSISWASLRQDCVSLSSTESEYVALTEAGKESVWLKRALSDYNASHDQPVLIRGDNQGSMALASNPGFHRRTKHIELRYHFIRKLKEDGNVDLEYIDTHHQVADILTKPVSESVLVKHRDSMGLRPVPRAHHHLGVDA